MTEDTRLSTATLLTLWQHAKQRWTWAYIALVTSTWFLPEWWKILPGILTLFGVVYLVWGVWVVYNLRKMLPDLFDPPDRRS